MSPTSVRASTAANWNVPAARSASTARRLDRLGRLLGDDAGEARRGGRPAAAAAASRISARRHGGSGSVVSRPWRSATARSTSLGGARAAPGRSRARRTGDADLDRGTLEPVNRSRADADSGDRTSSVHDGGRYWPADVTAPSPCSVPVPRPPRARSPFAHRGGAGDWPGEHDAGVRGRASTSATATSRPTSTSPPTACCVAFHDDRLDRVTDRPGIIAELPWREVAAGAGRRHASRSRCSRTCSPRGPTSASTSTPSPTRRSSRWSR